MNELLFENNNEIRKSENGVSLESASTRSIHAELRTQSDTKLGSFNASVDYVDDSNPFGSSTAERVRKIMEDSRKKTIVVFLEMLSEISWKDFEVFLSETEKLSVPHVKNMMKYAMRWGCGEMYCSDEIVNYPKCRKKQSVMNCISKLCQYFDYTYSTEFQAEWIKFLHQKRQTWAVASVNVTPKTKFNIYKNWSKKKFLDNCSKLGQTKKSNLKFSTWVKFVYTTGLRPDEAMRAFNEHDEICDGKVMELFWHRRNKHAHAVYCHPELHKVLKKHKFHISQNSGSHYKIVNSRTVGCEVRFLRKVNFTKNCDLSVELANFMQGTASSLRERVYYLGDMHKLYEKWVALDWL